MAEPTLYLSEFNEEKTWKFNCPVCGETEETYYNPFDTLLVHCYYCGAKITVLERKE